MIADEVREAVNQYENFERWRNYTYLPDEDKREPLKPGNKYFMKYDHKLGFMVTNMSLPGTEFNDNGLPGVSVKWLGLLSKTRTSGWFICNNEEDFWNIWQVKSAISL